MPLSYRDLAKAVESGRATGRWYMIPRHMQTLVQACLNYTKNGGLIRSPKLLEILMPVVDFLKNQSSTPPAASYSLEDMGSTHSEGILLKKIVLDVLDKLKRRPDARRKVPPLTRAFLKAFVKAPIKLVSKTLLSQIVKALKTVKEALSPRLRLVKTGSAVAWSISMIAYQWGNKRAVSWRRDEGFAMYWGMMLQSWPKFMQTPQATV
jgi:hypothetical protein